MPLSHDHTRRIQRVLNDLQELLKSRPTKATKLIASTRIRRTGKELETFKKAIVAERKRGIPVSELAEKYGVTPSYIYQLPAPAPVAKASKSKAPAKAAKKVRKKANRMPAKVDASPSQESEQTAPSE